MCLQPEVTSYVNEVITAENISVHSSITLLTWATQNLKTKLIPWDKNKDLKLYTHNKVNR